jgi:hypothetical protein
MSKPDTYNIGALPQMQNWEKGVQNIDNLNQGLMDPNSQYNRNQRTIMSNQGFDQMAFQNTMSERNAAMSGGGGTSFAPHQMNRERRKLQGSLLNMAQGSLQQNYMQGLSGLTNNLANKESLANIYASQSMANTDMNNAHKNKMGALMTGFSGGGALKGIGGLLGIGA